MKADPVYREHFYPSGDGLSLYYRSYGDADRVLICIPGLTRNSKDFEDLATRHAANWRVITPDLRGRGQSERDPIPSRYQHLTYAADIWKLADDLGISKFAIIGTSLGGAIAMIMASQQPERLLGVVLNDVGPVIPDAAVRRLMEYVGRIPPLPDWEAATAAVRSVYELAFPNRPDSFWLAHAKLSMCESSDGFIIQDADPAIGKVLRKGYQAVKLVRFLRRFGLMKKTAALIDDGYWKQFKAMTMPSLLLRGATSDVLTEETVAAMKIVHPAIETITVADRGHAPFLDEPEATTAIDSFLQRLADDSSTGKTK